MRSIRFLVAVGALATATGCSNNQVRYLTASRWTPPPAAQGQDASKTERILYVTYYEGTCSSGVLGFGQGCSSGDSKLRRCNLAADNTMVCVDEADANRGLLKK